MASVTIPFMTSSLYVNSYDHIPRRRSQKETAPTIVRVDPYQAPLSLRSRNTKGYELTELGQQFVHYAMTDIPLRIEFKFNTEQTVEAE